MFESKTVAELVQIAAAGGGFRMKAGSRDTQELVRIAAAAASGSAQVCFTGLGARSLQELVQIGAAGNGKVVFED